MTNDKAKEINNRVSEVKSVKAKLIAEQNSRMAKGFHLGALWGLIYATLLIVVGFFLGWVGVASVLTLTAFSVAGGLFMASVARGNS